MRRGGSPLHLARMLLLFALLWAPAASAEPPALTVSSYTALAMESSPEVRAADEAWRASDAAYKSQFAAMVLPTAAFTGTAYPYGHNPANGYVFQTWRLNRSDMSFNTTLNYNLFNSFQDLQKTRAASLAREAAARALLAARQDRAFAAVQAYFDLDSKNELLEVARQNLKAQSEQHQQSLDLYNHGMKSLADLLKSETDWRSSQLRLVSAEADQKTSLSAFNTLIDRGPLDAAPLNASLTPGTTDLPQIAGDLARSMERRPEVVAARAQLERAKVAFEQAVQGLLPTVKVDATWNRSDTANFGGAPVAASTLGIPNPNYYVGLSLSLPFGFNGVSQAYGIVQARAERRRAESALETQRRAVTQEVTGAYIGLEKDLRTHEVAAIKEGIAKRALDLVGDQYRQGSADAIRMNQAQNDYLDARVQRVLALHDIMIDRARYKRAVGEPVW
jgi:outer membrane protein TolC